MEQTLSLRSRGNAAVSRPLWIREILSAGALFLCAIVTLQGLLSVNRIAADKMLDLEGRLSFISRFSGPEGLPIKPVRGFRDADAGQAIGDIRELAQRAGVTIERFAVGLETGSKKNKVSALPVELSVIVPQEGFLSFIAGLRQLDFLARITSLSARPDTLGDENLRLVLKMERLRLLSPVTRKALMRTAMDLKLPERKDPFALHPGIKIFKNIIQPRRRIADASMAPQETFDAKNFSLVGIIDDGCLKAVIEDKSAAKSCFLVKDDEIGGMRVVEILEQEVVLEGASGRYSLTL
ncbi:MAG TPA: hypothetical protein DCL35_04365 [Candidatus Omnitrophica bacterium]|nr:hypothetical protein [Candidatus Omnitrophota bacterium]